jgi:hypothetical protein
MEALFDTYWPIIAQVVAILTAITALTPSRSDNMILDNILRFMNLLAGNVLKNRNKDAR